MTIFLCALAYLLVALAVWGIWHSSRDGRQPKPDAMRRTELGAALERGDITEAEYERLMAQPEAPAKRKPFQTGECPMCRRVVALSQAGDPVRRHICVIGSPWHVKRADTTAAPDTAVNTPTMPQTWPPLVGILLTDPVTGETGYYPPEFRPPAPPDEGRAA